MLASELVKEMGDSLIGRLVDTPRYGAYPGGIAPVTQIKPDPAAPEIVFLVEHPDPEVGTMGIFDQEEVTLIPETKET